MPTHSIKDANPHINDFHHLPIALEHDIVYAKSHHERRSRRRHHAGVHLQAHHQPLPQNEFRDPPGRP